MRLLPVEMQDLPLSSRMYPLAQEHTTEFCSSLQNWSQSPLSRLQNFRMAVRDACWFSGQAGETEAVAGQEKGQKPQGDIHPPGALLQPLARTKGGSHMAHAHQLVQTGWAAQSSWWGDRTMPVRVLFSLPRLPGETMAYS